MKTNSAPSLNGTLYLLIFWGENRLLPLEWAGKPPRCCGWSSPAGLWTLTPPKLRSPSKGWTSFSLFIASSLWLWHCELWYDSVTFGEAVVICELPRPDYEQALSVCCVLPSLFSFGLLCFGSPCCLFLSYSYRPHQSHRGVWQLPKLALLHANDSWQSPRCWNLPCCLACAALRKELYRLFHHFSKLSSLLISTLLASNTHKWWRLKETQKCSQLGTKGMLCIIPCMDIDFTCTFAALSSVGSTKYLHSVSNCQHYSNLFTV